MKKKTFCWKFFEKRGKNSKNRKGTTEKCLQGLSRLSRNHHLYGVGIWGIPPTTAKRTVVKGTTKIENKFVDKKKLKKRGKNSKKCKGKSE